MIVAKELLLYIPWWFWLISLTLLFLTIRYFIKNNEQPFFTKLITPFSSILFSLMMLDIIFKNVPYFENYYIIIDEIFSVGVILFVICIIAGCKQAVPNKDVDSIKLERFNKKALTGWLFALVCTVLATIIYFWDNIISLFD